MSSKRPPSTSPGAPAATVGAAVETAGLLSTDRLVKSYRKRRVVNEVSIRVAAGEIVGLLGSQRGRQDHDL